MTAATNIIDQFFDRVFVINLKARLDKWELMKQELQRHGIRNCEHFSAIRPSLAELPNTFYSKMKLASGSTDLNNYLIGSCGCKLSHLAVIQEALSRGMQRVLILEDDVIFKWRGMRVLERVISELPDVWHMLYMGGNHVTKPSHFSKRLTKVSCLYTTYAYGLNLNIGAEIVSSAPKSGKEIDVFFAEEIQPKYQAFAITPAIAYQRSGWSDIVNAQVDYSSVIS